MSFLISCELCGTSVEAERRSRMYCQPCRSKAVVLLKVCKALNSAIEVDPVTMVTLIEQRVEIENSALAGTFGFLDGATHLSIVTVLNMALREYGSITLDGYKFEIVRWADDFHCVAGRNIP